jgi:hypothetical protein
MNHPHCLYRKSGGRRSVESIGEIDERKCLSTRMQQVIRGNRFQREFERERTEHTLNDETSQRLPSSHTDDDDVFFRKPKIFCVLREKI